MDDFDDLELDCDAPAAAAAAHSHAATAAHAMAGVFTPAAAVAKQRAVPAFEATVASGARALRSPDRVATAVPGIPARGRLPDALWADDIICGHDFDVAAGGDGDASKDVSAHADAINVHDDGAVARLPPQSVRAGTWQRSASWLAALDALGVSGDVWAAAPGAPLRGRLAASPAAALPPPPVAGGRFAELLRSCNVASALGSPLSAFPGLPCLLVYVEWLSVSESDALAVVRDPTGAMHACFTRRVLDEAGPAALRPGAALLLRDVPVWAPRPGAKYLSVTPACVVRVFPPA